MSDLTKNNEPFTNENGTEVSENTERYLRQNIGSVILVTVYLLAWLTLHTWLANGLVEKSLPPWISLFVRADTQYYCGICGGVGGVLYCLRGVYLNYCVNKSWDNSWLPWYFIRPIASIVTGTIAYYLLQAGLFVLEAKTDVTKPHTHYGYYAFSFIAGYNVDQFLKKVEDVAKTTWGIDKSRTGDKN